MSKTKSYHSYLIETLKDPSEAAAYLNAALEENEPKIFLKALRNVAEANGGIGQILATGELNQENLGKMLLENTALSNLTAILDSLGLKLEISVKDAKAA